jgi:hypothetical protein
MSDTQAHTGATQAQRHWITRVLQMELSEPDSNSAKQPGISPVQLGKSILLWRGAVAKTATDLTTLRGKIMTALHADADMQTDDYAKVEGNFNLFDTITDRLNESLVDELTDVQNAAPDKRATPIATAQARLKEYIAFVETYPTLDMLADNEYLQLTTKADLLKTLRAIDAAISA